MFIRFCIAVLLVAALSVLGLAFWRDDGALAVYAIPLVLLLAGALAFKPQLDWAYYKRFRIDLDEPLRKLFAAQLPSWYQSLTDSEALAFRQNTSLVRRGLDVKLQHPENKEERVPEDVAVLIASQLARLLPPERFVVAPFETVILYAHPFPSPAWPQDWHNSELYIEDGVLLFNFVRAAAGVFEPAKNFNLALYEWTRVLLHKGLLHVDGLAGQASTLGEGLRERILRDIGLPDEAVDWAAVAHTLALDNVQVTA